eukprot:TRINITY_DN63303_c0_g1_i1.p1 TRINITY_DN63303_c0_g1~~TRINITY_DN63303_c0_g1_i1.p1  ORF type:complete len:337 (-),score=53.67 TRINITY_DN63303_c0_g1_i1:14-1024(-)
MQKLQKQKTSPDLQVAMRTRRSQIIELPESYEPVTTQRRSSAPSPSRNLNEEALKRLESVSQRASKERLEARKQLSDTGSKETPVHLPDASEQLHLPELRTSGVEVRLMPEESRATEDSVSEDELDTTARNSPLKLRSVCGGRQIQPDPTITIFLAVDGVLQPLHRREDSASACLRALEQIVRCCNATIVLACAWRLKLHGRNTINKLLRMRGLAGIQDSTPDLSDSTSRREDEIIDWLCRHPQVEHWLALDGIDLAAATSPHSKIMKRHFLKVDPKTGLKPGIDTEKAIRLLHRVRGDAELFWSVRPVDKSLALTYPGVRPLRRGGSQPFFMRRY